MPDSKPIEEDNELLLELRALMPPIGKGKADEHDVLRVVKDHTERVSKRREIEARIDETKRWMPISPDPLNSWDVRFMKAGADRIAELEKQLKGLEEE